MSMVHFEVIKMEKIVTLPKTAHIKCNTCNGLKIVNHRVENRQSFLGWMCNGVHDWDTVLPQLIRQGFHFGAVIDECISDLQDVTKFAHVINWTHGYSSDYSKMFSKSMAGRRLATEFIQKLLACKNWNDLHNVINPDGDFQKYMSRKAKNGVDFVHKRHNGIVVSHIAKIRGVLSSE